jgi:hypothetical protein
MNTQINKRTNFLSDGKTGLRSISGSAAGWVIISLSIFAIATACKSIGGGDSFTINGHFTNCGESRIVLSEMEINSVVPLDSARVGPDGSFRITRKIGEPGFYILRFPDRKKFFLLLDRGETLDITGDCNIPSWEFSLKGSPGSVLLADFFRTSNKNRLSVDSVKNILRSKEGTPDFMKGSSDADAFFQDIGMKQRKTELDFLAANPNSLACLLVLNFTFGPVPILDIDNDYAYYQKVDSCLQKAYPNNKHVIYHHKRIMERNHRENVKSMPGNIPQGKQ